MRFKGSLGTAEISPLREAREQLEAAESLRLQRKFDRAETILSPLIRRYPDYFGAHHTFGLICADRGNYRGAVNHLVQAAMLNPRSWMTHAALAGVYLRLDAKEMAARTLEQARAIKPNEPTVLVTLGEVYSEEHEYELAREAYRHALNIEPGMTEAAIGLAYACTALGQHVEAVDALEGLLNRGQRSLAVLTALTGLPASFIRKDLLAELDKVTRRADEDEAAFRAEAGFVRATTLDAVGRHAEAWDCAIAANRFANSKAKEELARHIREREACLKYLCGISPREKSHAPGDEKLPITLFIQGPSRSGKTTMEGLVASLDGVKRGYENPSVENAICRAYQTAGLLTAWTLEHLPPQFYPLCSDIYVEELAQRTHSAKVFTNTHPAYIHDAALIAAILPNVRFVFMKRNLDDNLLRIFLRKYGRGNAYAYDLEAARDHIVWYHQMMDALSEKLPNIVRVIHYEKMIANPVEALSTVAELCGLPMSEQPLPALGDDSGCARPYREVMMAAIGALPKSKQCS